MAILANGIHERTVQAWNAFQAHPELHPYMQKPLQQALKKQAAMLEPLLSTAARASDDTAQANIETAFEQTHELIIWVHEGLRYRYRKHPQQLAALAPLKSSRDPAQDGVRLATLIRALPELTPAFLWQPDEGLTHAALVKQLRAQKAAEAAESQLGAPEKAALAALRKARASSHALWDEEGGLEAWIIANVPKDQQPSFGRERRQRVRAARPGAPTPPVGTPPTAP